MTQRWVCNPFGERWQKQILASVPDRLKRRVGTARPEHIHGAGRDRLDQAGPAIYHFGILAVGSVPYSDCEVSYRARHEVHGVRDVGRQVFSQWRLRLAQGFRMEDQLISF